MKEYYPLPPPPLQLFRKINSKHLPFANFWQKNIKFLPCTRGVFNKSSHASASLKNLNISGSDIGDSGRLRVLCEGAQCAGWLFLLPGASPLTRRWAKENWKSRRGEVFFALFISLLPVASPLARRLAKENQRVVEKRSSCTVHFPTASRSKCAH